MSKVCSVSGPIVKGDAVCVVGWNAGPPAQPIVARATRANLATSKTVLGVALLDPDVLGNVEVLVAGDVAPNGVTGLNPGGAEPSRIVATDINAEDPAVPPDPDVSAALQCRLKRIDRPDGSEFAVGTCDEGGNLAVQPRGSREKSSRHVFNVVAYGADPTAGDASDAAFAAMFMAVASAGGGVMFVPAGRYRLTDTIGPLPENSSLVGEAAGALNVIGSILELHGSADGLQAWEEIYTYDPAPPLPPFGTVSNSTANVEIANLHIRGRNPANATGTGIDIVGGANFRIRNCKVSGFPFLIVLDGAAVVDISENQLLGEDGGRVPEIGIWLVSGQSRGGDAYTAGDATNRISVRANFIDGSNLGIFEEGGAVHHFSENLMNLGIGSTTAAFTKIVGPTRSSYSYNTCEAPGPMTTPPSPGWIGEALIRIEGAPTGLRFEANFFGHTGAGPYGPAIKFFSNGTYQLTLVDNHFACGGPAGAIRDAATPAGANFGGLLIAENNYCALGPLFGAPNGGAQSAIIAATFEAGATIPGVMLNALRAPCGALDVALLDATKPMFILRSDEYALRQYDASALTKQLDFARLVSPTVFAPNIGSTNHARSREWKRLDADPTPATTSAANVGILDAAAGLARITVVARRDDDPSKLGVWRISQAYSRNGANVALSGAPVSDSVAIDTDGAFVAPVLVANGADLEITLSSHAAASSTWIATIELVQAGY